MSVRPPRAIPLVLYAAAILAFGLPAHAVVLPPSCAGGGGRAGYEDFDSELRKQVEAKNETDPAAAFAILCAAIPRVAREYGERSDELAWWTASIATPLIAYMDKFDEALPQLEFARPLLETAATAGMECRWETFTSPMPGSISGRVARPNASPNGRKR